MRAIPLKRLLSKPAGFLLPILLLLLLTLQTGCASWQDLFENNSLFGNSYQGVDTPESLAMDGLEEFNHGKYYAALKKFDDLKSRFPFSAHSMLAELKSADCQYYLNNYPEALLLYQEFEERHPTNEAIPYVIFQVGMCNYKQIATIDRDPAGAVESVKAFSRLLRAHPDTSYTKEAQARITAARNFLANHEFYVSNFYVRTKSYDQAKVRLNYLLANYPDTEVAARAQTLLTAVENGTPPQNSWLDWLPDLGLPDWHTFSLFGNQEK